MSSRCHRPGLNLAEATAVAGRTSMSLLLEFSMFPTDRGESVGAYVARLVGIVRASGLPYRVGPMGTTVEGQAEEVFELIKRCLAELQRDCRRVAAFIKLDWRADGEGRIDSKVASLAKRLGHDIRT